MASFLKDPIPHDEAVDYIAGKAAVPQSVYKKLLPELRARAVAVAGIEALDVVQRVRDTIAELPAGGDWDELKKRIIGELGPYFEEDAAAARAELLLRMHGWQGYAAAQYRELEEMKDAFPYRQYLSSEDSRVRPTHAALHGVVLPADSPFWHNHTPPWEWGCRCDVVGLTEADAEDVKAADAAKELPEQRDFFDGARAAALESGRLTRGPDADFDVRTSRERGNENGFEWRPGEMRLPVEELRKRYDPEVWAEFETWARGQQLEDKGTTVWDWLGGRELEPVREQAGKKPAAKSRNQNPISKAVKIGARLAADVREPAADVLGLIDRLHGGKELPEIPLKRAATSATYYGAYVFREYRRERRIEVDSIRLQGGRTRGEVKMTMAHEIGHYIDHHILGDGVFGWGSTSSKASVSMSGETLPGQKEPAGVWKEFWDAVEASKMRPKILAASGKLNHKQTTYFLRGDEIWARAYAQWVAKRSGDPEMIGALEQARMGVLGFRQWGDDEFEPIAAAIDKILGSEGLL